MGDPPYPIATLVPGPRDSPPQNSAGVSSRFRIRHQATRNQSVGVARVYADFKSL